MNESVELIPPSKMRVNFQIKNIKIVSNQLMQDIAAEFQILKFDKQAASAQLERQNPEFNMKATHKAHVNKALKEGLKSKFEDAQHYIDHPTALTESEIYELTNC